VVAPLHRVSSSAKQNGCDVKASYIASSVTKDKTVSLAPGLVITQSQFDMYKEHLLRLNTWLSRHRYLFEWRMYSLHYWWRAQDRGSSRRYSLQEA